MPQADALAGALDQAGDVRHDKGGSLANADHTEHRGEGGEVVIRHRGLCLTDDGEQGGLAHVRESDQPHICQKLELQPDVPLLAGRAVLCKAGDLPRRSGKVGVPPAAAPALCGGELIHFGHICHHGPALILPDDGAARHTDDKAFTLTAVAAAALAILPAGGGVFPPVAEVRQRGEVVVHLKDDVPAASAVAAVRSACSHIFFTVKGDGAVTAVARLDVDDRIIYKHKFLPPEFPYNDKNSISHLEANKYPIHSKKRTENFPSAFKTREFMILAAALFHAAPAGCGRR